MSDIIAIIVSVLLAASGFIWRKSAVAKLKSIQTPAKKDKQGKKYSTWMIVLGLYILVTQLIQLVFGKHQSKMIEVSLATLPHYSPPPLD